ncbi:ankyrin repeat domain-containing protein [Dietzia aerolata]|uniref:Ankyrin repeat domain-containing protein n=1 Tax=Dietzia aerolata TaxID=595984 RepID=A0ABV5JX84_9ACTN
MIRHRPRGAGATVGVTALALLLTACATDTATDAAASPEAPSTTVVTDTAPATTAPTLSPEEQQRLDTELIAAAWADDVPAARELIARGADVNATDDTVQSAYLIATSEGYTELLDLTLANGADMSSLDSYDGTGLIRAAERGHADIIGRLIRHDVEIDHVNNLGWTGLHEALIFADQAGRPARGNSTDFVDTVRVIVAAGGDLTIPAQLDGATPLELARRHGLTAQASLIEQAVAADATDRGTQADADAELLQAAVSGDTDAAALALRRGADIETRNAQGQTPLVVATKNNHPRVAALLLYLGGDPDAQDDIRDSAFLYAGAEGYDEILAMTLAHGADVTSTNRFGGTALIPAGEGGYASTAQILVDAGVPVDHVNDLGWTALHEAIIYGDGTGGHLETIRILLAGGADPTLPDGDGTSPRDLAAARGQERVVALLEQTP